MPLASDLFNTIQASQGGLSLAELLAQHPQWARRTVQRMLAQWVQQGQITARGEGRARRYSAPALSIGFPQAIALSADSRDILAYIDQPAQARTPVGYQRDFLQAYQPNQTWYLPASTRRQLHHMGQTDQPHAAAGTYSRAILGRLLIDLSWASSHLEGNTYSRLDARELIEHGKAASGKGATETQMILNHKSAIELLVDNIDTVGFNRFTLMNLHSA